MLIKDLRAHIIALLRPLYDEREAISIASLYIREKIGLPNYEISLKLNDKVEDTIVKSALSDTMKLAKGVPIQQVLGYEEFFGLKFNVSSDVLIPRPETEELVQMIIKEIGDKEVFIWDIGTGSGCISISLAKFLPKAKVFASDISLNALVIARENAKNNGVSVVFAQSDMLELNSPFGDTKFDIIVSNPPYVPISDRKKMHINVSEYEPEIALFVPDDDKLLFYKAISLIGEKYLKSSGKIFIETYNRFHEDLTAVFLAARYQKIESINDFFGQNRFMKIERFI